LHVLRLREEDAGMYQCQAVNVVGQSKTMSIDVVLDPSQSELLRHIQPIIITYRMGQKSKLCILREYVNKTLSRYIGVNSYWAQGLKPPTFMIMGLAYMTSPPTFVT